MSHVESQTQQGCVKWFKSTYPEYAPLLFAVPNGGARSKIEGRILKGEGVTSGVSDLILMLPRQGFHALCIEMKKETYTYNGLKEKKSRGYQSKEQKEWQAAVEQQGYKYAVIYTREEFEALIKEYTGEDRDSLDFALLNNPFFQDNRI